MSSYQMFIDVAPSTLQNGLFEHSQRLIGALETHLVSLLSRRKSKRTGEEQTTAGAGGQDETICSSRVGTQDTTSHVEDMAWGAWT